MSGLVLKLAPFERVLINGVVLENGDRRGRITICTPNANILRLRDAIHPGAATTPITRLCYIAQLVLAGEADEDEGRDQLLAGLRDLDAVFIGHQGQRMLADAKIEFAANRFYPGLKRLRSMLPQETLLLRQGAA